VLEIIDLCAAYGETGVLHGISLTADPGQITAIIGANGAGKSTMLKCVTGLLKPSRGRILWEGRDLSKVSTAGIVSLGVTMVPEGRHIFPQMTVAENLDMGAYLRHDKDGIKEDRAWVIELFPSLHSRLRQQAGTLSGGEQQMLAVGRALMSAPKLLLMDEPSMGLAPVIVEEVFRAIGRIRQMGKTVLLVEQNAVLTLTIADKGYVLELGNIVLTGTGQELLHNPKVEKAYLGV
jgi:ABC-type branched-chain amino acid transport systems, ATPase component